MTGRAFGVGSGGVDLVGCGVWAIGWTRGWAYQVSTTVGRVMSLGSHLRLHTSPPPPRLIPATLPFLITLPRPLSHSHFHIPSVPRLSATHEESVSTQGSTTWLSLIGTIDNNQDALQREPWPMPNCPKICLPAGVIDHFEGKRLARRTRKVRIYNPLLTSDDPDANQNNQSQGDGQVAGRRNQAWIHPDQWIHVSLCLSFPQATERLIVLIGSSSRRTLSSPYPRTNISTWNKTGKWVFSRKDQGW